MSLDNVCRLCLYKTPRNLPFLKSNSYKMLEALTSIKPSDEILRICLKCNLKLKLAYNFQQDIIKADEKLRNGYLNTLSTQQESCLIKTEKLSLIDNVEMSNNLCNTRCIICNSIIDENSMKLHLQQHFDESQHCDICNQIFSDIRSYRQHLFKHPQYRNYQCDKCETTFRYKSLYNVHMEKVHPHPDDLIDGERILIEDKVTGKLPRHKKQSPSDHINELQKKGIQPKLAQELLSLCEIKKLIKEKTKNGGPHTCEICLKQFSDKRQLQNHNSNHRRKLCPICNKQITASNFNNHITNHNSGPQVCEHCGRTFANIDSLRGHMFYKHKQGINKCKVCETTFESRQKLNLHRKREHKGPGKICEKCGKKFFSSYDLKKHIRGTHLKERPYVCEFCNRGFSGLHNMKTHRRQHTNETPYKCEVCGEGFRQNVSLKAHRKSKHNIVEAVTCRCEMCGKGFSSQHALKTHMRKH